MKSSVSREETRRSYDLLSHVYGFLSSSSEKRFVREAVDRYLIPAAGERILEVGFGAGQVLVELAQRVGDDGKVYGLDISEGMVRVTRRRVRRRGLERRVELVQGDAAKMPFGDAHFDAVFMSFTLELFPEEEIPVVLGECFRVLRGGGRLCLASMYDSGERGPMMRLYLWMHRRFPRFVDCRPIRASQYVAEAGFRVEATELLSMWGLPVEIVLGRKDTGE